MKNKRPHLQKKKKSPTVIGINRTLNLNYSFTIIKKKTKSVLFVGVAQRDSAATPLTTSRLQNGVQKACKRS